ncbi:hypothetical protein V6N11_051878 [Hibiscus sabdariffa]|uniref:Protein kinase domain-containing protein n=1 Tax=Hibiscus sabdariffa TaxID=183260 RepID=A0ABR2U8B5_9ROSI
MAGDDSVASLYRVLADQCLSLEANHAKLREEFDELVQQDKTSDKEVTLVLDSIDSTSYPISWTFPGYFSTGSPFRNVLESIGHAIHVSSAASGRITFWLVCSCLSCNLEWIILFLTLHIDIMRKLRQPNVLLFMGVVYSQERLAIVTEFLPRGSLFKALHKNNQELDVKRRMRMALDVARGMNYLHHRNPPIVHRDLKSSNLLVDRNWNVKVGDFGLSRWKNGTFLTIKSGRGRTQVVILPQPIPNIDLNRSDVFSFGVILWELMTVSISWSNLNSLQVEGVVGFMDRHLELPEGLDPHIESIICDCW